MPILPGTCLVLKHTWSHGGAVHWSASASPLCTTEAPLCPHATRQALDLPERADEPQAGTQTDTQTLARTHARGDSWPAQAPHDRGRNSVNDLPSAESSFSGNQPSSGPCVCFSGCAGPSLLRLGSRSVVRGGASASFGGAACLPRRLPSLRSTGSRVPGSAAVGHGFSRYSTWA